jgi:transposase InsO family protein
MKAMKLKGFSKKRRCVTTRSAARHTMMPDLVRRNFTAPGPNRVYVGDITYLPCAGGRNMYLASVTDVYSRKLVGHALADYMRTSLVVDALAHAKDVRGSLDGAVFHSDHGSVYTSHAFRSYCDSLGVTQSMVAVGTSADNALAESFNATLKREVLKTRRFSIVLWLAGRKSLGSVCATTPKGGTLGVDTLPRMCLNPFIQLH